MKEIAICNLGSAIDGVTAVQNQLSTITNRELESGGRPESLLVRIADITINVWSDDPELEIALTREMKEFRISESPADVQVRTAWADLQEVTLGVRLFDSGGPWQLYRNGDAYLFRFIAPSLGTLPYKVASFNRDFTSGQVYLHHEYFDTHEPIYPLEYPLDELLMTHLLGKGRGVEIHALGLADSEGKGHLFVGQSGAGKTTMARLWEKEEGVTILSDDRIVLRRMGETFWMYGTPWHGEAELACPTQVPLSHIYFLRQRPNNELVPMRGTEAVGRLFACSFPAFYDSAVLEFSLSFLHEVADAVPCCELGFLPDRTVIRLIQGQEGTA